MREHTKIYSNNLYYNAIFGLETNLKIYGNFTIKIQKDNNDLYELRLYKDGFQQFVVANTIDCLYALVDGYYKALINERSK